MSWWEWLLRSGCLRHYPGYALSRFSLRRLCMGRVLPCTPFLAGRHVRYMVRVSEVVAVLVLLARCEEVEPYAPYGWQGG